MKLLILLLLVSCVQNKCDRYGHYTERIYRVGGCDSTGQCGVMYNSGKTDLLYYPVPTQQVILDCEQ